MIYIITLLDYLLHSLLSLRGETYMITYTSGHYLYSRSGGRQEPIRTILREAVKSDPALFECLVRATDDLINLGYEL